MLEKIVFPLCNCCKKQTTETKFGLCFSCFEKLISFNPENRCKYCGYPLEKGSNICGKCFSRKSFFDSGVFLFPYNECGKALIHSIKFEDKLEYLEVINFFINQLTDFINGKEIDFITYVPSSLFHYLSRGYSVPRELAKRLSSFFNIPYKKIVYTKRPYKKLLSKSKSVKERKSIVGNFFRVKSDGRKANGILLVDDVFTTGTTVNTVASLVKKNNVAEKVYFFTLSMVVKD